MGEIINLNKRRKVQAKVAKQNQAAANRVKYGRTKQEKTADKLKTDKLERHLAAHKRETPEE